MDMDIKAIEQMVEQVLREIQSEQIMNVTEQRKEGYGLFSTIDEAIEASEKAQKNFFIPAWLIVRNMWT